jgi:hypothetical protein
MSNLLKVAMIDLILSLHCQGRSEHRIMSELGINRETGIRYLSQARDAANQLWGQSTEMESVLINKTAAW